MIKKFIKILFISGFFSISAFADINNNIDKKTKDFLESVLQNKGKKMQEMTPSEIRIAFDQMQSAYKVRIPKVNVAQKVIVTNGMKIPLTIVKSVANKNKILPVVVFFHGGGWVMGDYKSHELLIAKISVGADVAVVFVDYPLSPEYKYPEAINQSYAAAKWISENGAKIGVDGKRLAVVGNSAGGNISAVVSQMAKDNGKQFVKYQVLLSPVTDLISVTDSYNQFGNGDYVLSTELIKYFRDNYVSEDRRSEVYVSPLMADLDRLSGLPKSLIITTEYDMHRDEGEAYAYKLMQAGVDVTAIRYLGTIHSAESFNALANTPPAKSIINQIIRELKVNL